MTDTEWSERIDQAISEYPEVGEYLEAIRGNVEALASRLAAVEKLHQQSSEQTDDAGVAYTVCVECTQINRYGQVRWPCLTIKAVRGE